MSRALTLVRSGGALYAVPGERVRAVRHLHGDESPPPLVPHASPLGAELLDTGRALDVETPAGSRSFAIGPAVEFTSLDEDHVLPLPPLVVHAVPLFAALAAFPDRSPVLVLDADRLVSEEASS